MDMSTLPIPSFFDPNSRRRNLESGLRRPRRPGTRLGTSTQPRACFCFEGAESPFCWLTCKTPSASPTLNSSSAGAAGMAQWTTTSACANSSIAIWGISRTSPPQWTPTFHSKYSIPSFLWTKMEIIPRHTPIIQAEELQRERVEIQSRPRTAL